MGGVTGNPFVGTSTYVAGKWINRKGIVMFIFDTEERKSLKLMHLLSPVNLTHFMSFDLFTVHDEKMDLSMHLVVDRKLTVVYFYRTCSIILFRFMSLMNISLTVAIFLQCI